MKVKRNSPIVSRPPEVYTPEQIAAHLEMLVGGIAEVTPNASKPGLYDVSIPFALEDVGNDPDQLETQFIHGCDDLSDALRDAAYALIDWGDSIVKARMKIKTA